MPCQVAVTEDSKPYGLTYFFVLSVFNVTNWQLSLLSAFNLVHNRYFCFFRTRKPTAWSKINTRPPPQLLLPCPIRSLFINAQAPILSSTHCRSPNKTSWSGRS